MTVRQLMQLHLLLSSGPGHEAHHSGQIDYLKGLQTAKEVPERQGVIIDGDTEPNADS